MKKIVTYNVERNLITIFHANEHCQFAGKTHFVLLDRQVKKLELEGCKICYRTWNPETYRYDKGGKL